MSEKTDMENAITKNDSELLPVIESKIKNNWIQNIHPIFKISLGMLVLFGIFSNYSALSVLLEPIGFLFKLFLLWFLSIISAWLIAIYQKAKYTP